MSISREGEQPIVLNHLEIQMDVNLDKQVMMAEGFQCWSTTKEMDRYSKISSIPGVVSWFTQFNLQGDYDFFNYSGQAGHIHSTGYTYFRDTQSNQIVFLGSISEESGYTYYKSDLNGNKFSLYKDIDGKVLKPGQTLCIKVFVAQRDQVSGLKSIWERYADYYDPKHEFRNPRHLTGWSSWYNFYERVTENDVVSSLHAFKEHKYPIDVFQIDDGFESQIGDWLDVDKVKFPRGMQALAEEIKQQDYIPGIWLAPYAVGFKSKIVKEHPDWLLKHPDGRFVVAGPNWGGFYAMDIYHPEVRIYLQSVFDTVIDVWGFKLLKLDFLFAAAMIPRLGKSRGEIMWDAMDLITEFTQKRALLLGSGVTLPSTWGRLEYSRVSSDASPWWDHSVLRIANVRERVATSNAITSTLNRWPMASTIFGSDPDVFFVRSNNNQLTKEEKHTLLVINIVFGQLVLMSDNVGLYDKQEHKLYSSIFPKPEAQVKSLVSLGLDVYQANYTVHGREYIFISNLSPLPYTAKLSWIENGHYFERSNVLISGSRVDWLPPQSQVFLKPHETRTFMKISKESKDLFMGSTGNIVPGSEIESISKEDEAVHITLRKPHMKQKTRIFIKLDTNDSPLPTVYVDNEQATRVERLVWDGRVSVAKVTLFG
ncbi:glycoside hydrolase superfamily [Mucor mucedo]|uniref:glycoside hydrolase superfamily n=1 Tax=Mucor mucedo TaxID=29922 RepID=UPI00221E8815|nr:glycoside hydrolase superfamily [Mucor mucedo]KAI7882095.1 glycoside hydrolase superfamily [Mucor mucedo]